MRYTIMGFNQQKIIEYDLSMDMVLLLDYINIASGSYGMSRIEEDGLCYIWLKRSKILEDLPVLKIKERQLSNLLAKLVDKGLLTFKQFSNEKVKGSKSYYAKTKKFNELLQDNTICNKVQDEESTGCNKLHTQTKTDVKNYISNKQLNIIDNTIKNNIIDNTKVLSNNVADSENNSFLKTSKKPKKSRYEKYIDIIDDFMFNNLITENKEIRDLLIQHLNMLLEKNQENKKQLYSNQYKGFLNEFTKLIRDTITNQRVKKEDFIKNSIQQSICNGWAKFYPIQEKGKNSDIGKLGESYGYKWNYHLTEKDKEIDYSQKF